MQQLGHVPRFMQQPLVIVLGVLTAAGAAKSGHGAWAAGGIVTFVLIYVSAVLTLMATRRLAVWVAQAASRIPGTSRTTTTPTSVMASQAWRRPHDHTQMHSRHQW